MIFHETVPGAKTFGGPCFRANLLTLGSPQVTNNLLSALGKDPSSGFLASLISSSASDFFTNDCLLDVASWLSANWSLSHLPLSQTETLWSPFCFILFQPLTSPASPSFFPLLKKQARPLSLNGVSYPWLPWPRAGQNTAPQEHLGCVFVCTHTCSQRIVREG